MRSARFMQATLGWLGLLLVIGVLSIGMPLAFFIESPIISYTFLVSVVLLLLAGVIMGIGSAVLTVLIVIEQHLNPGSRHQSHE